MTAKTLGRKISVGIIISALALTGCSSKPVTAEITCADYSKLPMKDQLTVAADLLKRLEWSDDSIVQKRAMLPAIKAYCDLTDGKTLVSDGVEDYQRIKRLFNR